MDNSIVSFVREHMNGDVISVGEDASLDDVLATFRNRRVSSVAVLGASGGVAGVVTMTDLMRASRFEGPRLRDPRVILPPGLRARDVMQTPVLSVREDASVGEAAAMLLAHRVHRVFVTRGESLVGVFSTQDAMRVVFLRRLATPLSQAMTAPVTTVGIGDPIELAVARLDEAALRALVVLDDETPIGLFTQLEAIRARALPANLRRNPVEELMSYETICLDVSTPLYRAAGHAISLDLNRMIAVEDRKLRGIVTGYDLTRALV